MSPAALPCAVLLSLIPVTAQAQTLADAMAACESFVVNSAIPDTVDPELTLFGDLDYATVDTELGPVFLTFAVEYGMNKVTYCDLMGADVRDDDGPVTATWAMSLPLVKTWLAARVADGGGKLLPMLAGADLMFVACRDDGGYFISALPGMIGSRVENLPDTDWPLYVRINRWTGNAAKPCDF